MRAAGGVACDILAAIDLFIAPNMRLRTVRGSTAIVARFIRPLMRTGRFAAIAAKPSLTQAWTGMIILGGAGDQHRDVDAVGREFVVYGFAEGECVGLGRGIVRHERHRLQSGEAGHEKDAAASAPGESLPEMMGQAQVRLGVDAHLAQQHVAGARAHLTDHGRLRSGLARSQIMIEATVTVAS